MKQALQRSYVKLMQGTVSGVREVLPNGMPMCVYRGVPYATPPIGNLRFKPPIPLQKFSEPVLDCSEFRDTCLQNDMFTASLQGSEDCLFLNIYTPKDPEMNHSKKLPVMVMIHGGGFASGSGEMHLPDYLVQEEVIVVTCNYRLGALGFLYLPKAGITGNAGLYDQLMALRWVNENIDKFNGDPNNVTLFGESAGASSTHIHLISPISRKYFHKAICQSGTIGMEWVIQQYAEQKTHKLAELLGCEAKNDKDILEFLQKCDSTAILEKTKKTSSDDEKYRGLPFSFKPVIEKKNPNSIFPHYPHEQLQCPDSFKIPVIFGYNSLEGIVIIQKVQASLNEHISDMKKCIPLSVNVTIGSASSENLAEEIKQFYFSDSAIEKRKATDFIDIMSDIHFVNGFKRSLELQKRYQKDTPLYCYRFSFDGELNMFKKFFSMDKIKGACHADDLFYLFKMGMLDTDVPKDSPAYKVRDHMCKMWTNFAKFGDPTPDYCNLPFKWKPTENKLSDDNQFLEIGDDIKMVENPDHDRYLFWKDVYAKWNENFLKPKL